MDLKFRLAVLNLLLVMAFIAQAQSERPSGHWGIQGDFGMLNVPDFLVEKIDSGYSPHINGNSYQAGIVHFNPNGSPSYSFRFSGYDLDGTLDKDNGLTQLRGSATLRGVMATKYLNVLARKYVCVGFAVGGGVGQFDSHYVKYVSQSPESNETYKHIVPLFEVLTRFEVRPTSALSFGPLFGIRTGTLAAGGSVQLHFVK